MRSTDVTECEDHNCTNFQMVGEDRKCQNCPPLKKANEDYSKCDVDVDNWWNDCYTSPNKIRDIQNHICKT